MRTNVIQIIPVVSYTCTKKTYLFIYKFKLYFISLFSLNSASGLGELKCGVFTFQNQTVRSANSVVRVSPLSRSLFLPANSPAFLYLLYIYLKSLFLPACTVLQVWGFFPIAAFYRTYNLCLVAFALKALLMIDTHQKG